MFELKYEQRFLLYYVRVGLFVRYQLVRIVTRTKIRYTPRWERETRFRLYVFDVNELSGSSLGTMVSSACVRAPGQNAET